MVFDAKSFLRVSTALVLVSAGSYAESFAQCGGTLLEVEGEITSPGHPGNYPDRAACRWDMPAGPGDRTAFRLLHLDIEYESACTFDRLTVSFGERGGWAPAGAEGGAAAPQRIYCGSNLSLHVQPLVGTGPATVLFHSDDSVTRTGFRLHYAVLQETPPCDSGPCRNGARCRNRVLEFACACAHGFQGSTCEQDVDECASSPCAEGGGSCVDRPGGYACLCRPGQSGGRCQGGRDDSDEWGLCQPNPCLHGGTCRASRRQFHCLCPHNYTGNLCQHDVDSAGLGVLLAVLVVAFGVSLGAVTLCQLKNRSQDSPDQLGAEPGDSSMEGNRRLRREPTQRRERTLKRGTGGGPAERIDLGHVAV